MRKKDNRVLKLHGYVIEYDFRVRDKVEEFKTVAPNRRDAKEWVMDHYPDCQILSIRQDDSIWCCGINGIMDYYEEKYGRPVDPPDSFKFDESKLPHKWAINFRNMNTAIHGLFYGDDRKVVNQFYKELKSLDIDDENYEWDLMGILDGFEGYIGRIDEINFRNIRKLDSGRYGIEIDGVEYWIMNNVSEDLYMESN